MTSDQFTYWLQGFTELHGEPPTAEQWRSIKDHLALVFHKVTPALGTPLNPPIGTPPSLYPMDLSPRCSVVGGKADTSTRVYC